MTFIADTGCSYSATPHATDCDPGSIQKLSEPIPLGGIAGGLKIEYIGTITLETIDKEGNIIPFKDEVLINPDLPHRLLSPQAFVSHHPDGTRTGDVEEHVRVFHN